MHLNDKNYVEKNIVKGSSPEKFVFAITRSADKLLGTYFSCFFFTGKKIYPFKF